MANIMFDRGYRAYDPLRTPLTCLSAANQLIQFNPTELARYKIQTGDTLQSIAILYYGSKWSEMWAVIASVNNLNNPVSLPVGAVIIIPDLTWRTV